MVANRQAQGRRVPKGARRSQLESLPRSIYCYILCIDSLYPAPSAKPRNSKLKLTSTEKASSERAPASSDLPAKFSSGRALARYALHAKFWKTAVVVFASCDCEGPRAAGHPCGPSVAPGSRSKRSKRAFFLGWESRPPDATKGVPIVAAETARRERHRVPSGARHSATTCTGAFLRGKPQW